MIATTVKNFHMFNVGLVVSMPAIIIASLSGIHNERNQNEFLTATASQCSWIGSLTYLIQPFASIISGPISGTFQKLNFFLNIFWALDFFTWTEKLGCKLAMIAVNIPFGFGWFMLYAASEIWHIFLGLALLGLAVGQYPLFHSADFVYILCFFNKICFLNFKVCWNRQLLLMWEKSVSHQFVVFYWDTLIYS